MARKILNRRELREASDAAERSESGEGTTKKAAAPKKPAAKRKSRAKTAKEVRLKAFWGVFSQSLNPVVLFEYSERELADKKAEELSESKKSPHFVQLVKKVIEE
jgi:pyruvate/2-oxoglutarate dehydrogenase complex dihydrolipoamide acyltransferase (E2) component